MSETKAEERKRLHEILLMQLSGNKWHSPQAATPMYPQQKKMALPPRPPRIPCERFERYTELVAELAAGEEACVMCAERVAPDQDWRCLVCHRPIAIINLPRDSGAQDEEATNEDG